MKTLSFACCLFALLLSTPLVRAANNANDVASNYAGRSTYIDVNGGTGWAGGFTSSGGTTGAFLASSPQIDTAGLSFGLTGNSITRNFGPTTGSGLNADQSFQFRLQPGSVPQGGSYGLTMANSFSVSTALSLSYSTNNPDYLVTSTIFNPGNPTSQTFDTGVLFSTNPLTVAFSQGNGTFRLSLTPAGGSTTTLTNTFTGVADGIQLYASSGTTMYFNNVAVVPEPGSWAQLALGVVSLLGWRLSRARRPA